MAENSWHRYDMKKLRHCQSVTLCIQAAACTVSELVAVARLRRAADDRGPCALSVVFRDGLDRETVVRTACGRASSSSTSPVSHRGHAPAGSTSVIYRSTTNRLQIHASWTDHGLLANDDHWTPYILEYMCKLYLSSSGVVAIILARLQT